jgi:SAM-dependent methyltransferase
MMPKDKDYYEADRTLQEYLAFHFPDGDPLEALLGDATPPLNSRFPYVVRTLWEPRPEGWALDVGAACGRVTLDLARDHRFAVGLDLSRALMRGARVVQRAGVARYATIVEGDLVAEHEVAVSAPANAAYLVGDALRLPVPDARFDTVVALNLVDRVPDPRRALDELARVTAPGGTLIVASPFTWLPKFTPKENWLGGFLRNDEPVRGIEAVRTRFGEGFSILEERRLPFYIPHHKRTGQLGVAHLIKLRRDR